MPTGWTEESSPRPGDVYREYAVHFGGNVDWRVTDPRASAKGAQEFLPNPVHQFEIDDLEHAVRAEVLLDRWGGHLGTTEKKIRFNDRPWILIPELATTPTGENPEDYYYQDNPAVAVPLENLRGGTNTLEATCGALEGHNWGQWGMYSAIVRIYVDPEKVQPPQGRILSPQPGEMLGEFPRIEVRAESQQGVARVDILAEYKGYDEDGDGQFHDWHRSYHQPVRGEMPLLTGHVTTLWRARPITHDGTPGGFLTSRSENYG